MRVSPSLRAVRQKAWVAIRFVLFGCLGIGGLVYAVEIFVRREGPDPESLGLVVVLVLAGAASALWGVGEWGRWGYLLVIFSIPASLVLLFGLLELMPRSERGPSDYVFFAGPFAVPATCATTTYYCVRAWYSRTSRRPRRDGTSDLSRRTRAGILASALRRHPPEAVSPADARHLAARVRCGFSPIPVE